MELEHEQHLADLSRCNDIVNAISNNCKRLVRCEDGSVVLTNQECGTDLNFDADECRTSMEGMTEDPTLPRVLTEKFKRDILDRVYRECLPQQANEQEKRAREALCKASLPGLTALRRTLRLMLAEMKDDTLTSDDLVNFFEGHLCSNPMCIKDAFRDTSESDCIPLPRLNVSHPEWFYFPVSIGYLAKATAYIKLFLKDPCSKRCALCDTFFRVTEEDTPVNLYGLPEQFTLNINICSLYGRYTFDHKSHPLAKLTIKTSGGTDFVVTWGNEIYF